MKVFIGPVKAVKNCCKFFEGHGDGTYIGNNSLTTVNKNKQWISLHSEVSGKIFVDQGAEKPLCKGSSLLPAGIYDIKGNFEKGDVVEVYGSNGLIGKGEVRYSSDELRTVDGKADE